MPYGLGPHTAGEDADDVDRPPLFARAAEPSPVKAEPANGGPVASNDSRKPVIDDAAAGSRPDSKTSRDVALVSGADGDPAAKPEPSGRVQAGAMAAVSDTGVRPSTAEVAGDAMPERQRAEPAPRKGHANVGGKRKHGNEPRNGESAGRPAKAARGAAPPLNGKVNMYAGQWHSSLFAD